MRLRAILSGMLLTLAVGCGGGNSIPDDEIPHVDPESVRLETDLEDPSKAAGDAQKSMKGGSGP